MHGELNRNLMESGIPAMLASPIRNLPTRESRPYRKTIQDGVKTYSACQRVEIKGPKSNGFRLRLVPARWSYKSMTNHHETLDDQHLASATKADTEDYIVMTLIIILLLFKGFLSHYINLSDRIQESTRVLLC